MLRDDFLKFLDDLVLEVDVLENGFDDQVTVLKVLLPVVVIGKAYNTAHGNITVVRRHATALYTSIEVALDLLEASSKSFLVEVLEKHLETALRRDLCNTSTHQACSKDTDRGYGSFRLAEAVLLEGSAAKEEALEGVALGGLGKFPKRLRLSIKAGLEARLSSCLEHFENFWDCRVVSTALLECHLGGLVKENVATNGVVLKEFAHEPLVLVLGLELAINNLAGCRERRGSQCIGVHDLVDHAHLFGAVGFERLASEDHIKRGLHANDRGEALGTTSAGEETKLDFRKPNLGFRVRRCDSVVAVKRYFETTAQARSVDGSNEGLLRVCDASEKLLAVFGSVGAVLWCFEVCELLDVCSSDEVVLLATDKDSCFNGLVVFDGIEHGCKVLLHLAADGVDLGSWLVHGDYPDISYLFQGVAAASSGREECNILARGAEPEAAGECRSRKHSVWWFDPT
mmetsp:Transcript_19223/g.35565  ORF Transcript_19223/g.35565 Transcript_19223/m.35565 type:complete len:457 (-) Transcript_19223:164-1534(-)